MLQLLPRFSGLRFQKNKLTSIWISLCIWEAFMKQIFGYFTVLAWASLLIAQHAIADETALTELAGTSRLHSTIVEMTASDQAAALEKLMVQAQNGDVRAQYVIGVFYSNGFVVPRDRKAAETWFRMSAERSYAPAQEVLGVLVIQNSNGAKSDQIESFNWFYKAAKQGRADALYMVAVGYRLGEAVEKNEKTAAEWMLKAANKGNLAAQWEYAAMLREGNGVAKDLEASVNWLHKAATQGFGPAQHDLGYAYGVGQGVARDLRKSAIWIKVAADGGNDDARKIWSNMSQVQDSPAHADITRAAKRCVESNFQHCN